MKREFFQGFAIQTIIAIEEQLFRDSFSD